jgi:hypothetical protein
MDISIGPLLRRAIWGPAILFNAIVFPKVFYSSYAARIVTFAAIAGSVVWALQPHDIETPSTSYLFGFAPSWTLIVAAVLLLLCNPSRDFRRIRRKDNQRSGKADSTPDSQYEWESFPEQLSRRFWWSFDLLMNFRGLGWSYQKRQHQIPDDVKRLYDEGGIKVIRDGCQTEKRPGETRSSFLVKQCGYFVVDYVVLDFCIHLMDRDPWFNRPLNSNERLLFGYAAGNLNILVRPYRALLGTVATYSVMDLTHVAVALVSVGLGPRWLGTHGEPWMHPRLWGNLTELFNRGLPGTIASSISHSGVLTIHLGFWGNFWHDLFRFQFLTITRKLIPHAGNDKRSAHSFRGLLYMTIVFALSGSMHAAGSYAELRETAPLWLLAGFVVQSVGVALQEMVTMFLVKMKVGSGIRIAVINCYWFSWGWLTAPIVIGDMAACGLFQSKVLPFSVIDLFWKWD